MGTKPSERECLCLVNAHSRICCWVTTNSLFQYTEHEWYEKQSVNATFQTHFYQQQLPASDNYCHGMSCTGPCAHAACSCMHLMMVLKRFPPGKPPGTPHSTVLNYLQSVSTCCRQLNCVHHLKTIDKSALSPYRFYRGDSFNFLVSVAIVTRDTHIDQFNPAGIHE